MKKVLILSYYWPPSGGSGVQRWLKMSKYLPEEGWLPIVYTAEGGESPAIDESLKKDVHPDIEVLRTAAKEPYALYKRFVGQKKEEGFGAGFLNEGKKIGLAQKISIWVRGNFFIPDARMLWIKPSIRYLSNYLAHHQVDALISTGPPHSMHMIAHGLKKRFPQIPWIADFRDPWTTIDFYDQLMLSKWADRKHHRLEAEVLRSADHVIAVSEGCKDDLFHAQERPITVIPNGYDHADFSNLEPWDGSTLSITHIGSMNADRNPSALWQALGEKAREDSDFRDSLKIQLIGKTDHTVIEDLDENGILEHTERVSYRSHDEVLNDMSSSAVLLLVINNTSNAKGILTGKLFEYLAAGRPILCIGPRDGEAARLIEKLNAGVIVEHGDIEGSRVSLNALMDRFKHGQLRSDSQGVESFSRKAQAKQFVRLLDRFAGQQAPVE